MAERELRIGDRGPEVGLAQDLMNRVGMLLEDDGIFGAGTEAAVRDVQHLGNLPVTGLVDDSTWAWLRTQPEPSPVIATKAVTFIVRAEVGSRSYYDARASRPTFPGGQSGITIGVGYDLRFQSAAGFRSDWSSVLTRSQFDALLPFVGRQGSDELARLLGEIVIPWRDAWLVFIKHILPTYVTRTRSAFPGFDSLNRLCRGVLVSLVYNRGTAMEGDSRREMRDIRADVESGNLDAIPDEILAMKRLWPGNRGLQLRRDQEAAVFRDGLAISS